MKTRFSRTVIIFCTVFSLALMVSIDGNASFIFAGVKMLCGFLGGRFVEKVFDRTSFSSLLDTVIDSIFGQRREFVSLPDYYPEKQEKIKMCDESLKIVQQMQAHMREHRLTDEQLIHKLKEINRRQLTSVVNRIENLESRVTTIERQMGIQETKTKELDQEMARQRQRLLQSEIYVAELHREIIRVEGESQRERLQIQRDILAMQAQLQEQERKNKTQDQQLKQQEETDRRHDHEFIRVYDRMGQIIKTHFHFYYTGLKFESLFWQDYFKDQPIAKYDDILFEGAGTGLSLLLQRRVRIYGDLYYMISKPKYSKKTTQLDNESFQNRVAVSGVGCTALAHLTFFSRKGAGVEFGGGYAWTFYKIHEKAADVTVNEYDFRRRGMLASVGVTLLSKHVALFGQVNCVINQWKLNYGLFKGGLVLVL